MTAEMITAIGALILGIASLVSAILLNRKTVALLEWRMGEIEKSQNDSTLLDRIARMETDVAVIRTSMEFLKKEVIGQ